jgi:flagellar FliL protein
MSNEMFDTEEELAGEEQQPTAGKKKIGFLPAIVIDILKWAAIVIGAIIFIVGVVVITVRIMNRNEDPGSGSRVPLDSEYVEVERERLSWYSQLGSIRGQTRDEPAKTFIVNAFIGFEQNDEATGQELIDRNVQIKEEIAFYFAERTSDELEGPDNRRIVKQELKERLNRIMSTRQGREPIREVAFDQYEIIDF